MSNGSLRTIHCLEDPLSIRGARWCTMPGGPPTRGHTHNKRQCRNIARTSVTLSAKPLPDNRLASRRGAYRDGTAGPPHPPRTPSGSSPPIIVFNPPLEDPPGGHCAQSICSGSDSPRNDAALPVLHERCTGLRERCAVLYQTVVYERLAVLCCTNAGLCNTNDGLH